MLGGDVSRSKPPLPGTLSALKRERRENLIASNNNSVEVDSEGAKSRNRIDDSLKQRSYTSGNEVEGINGFSDVSMTATSVSDRGLVNGGEDREVIRKRANALGGKRQASTDTSQTLDDNRTLKEERLRKQFDDQHFPELGHRRSSKDAKRSGSFNMRRQMSGDKALGIFYHNRRSQMLDQESGDEGDKKSSSETFLERSGSYSSPHSPISIRASMSPNLRGVRDSGELNMPMSPLLSSSCNSDILAEGLRNMRKTERAERAESSTVDRVPPLSPSIVVNNDADSSDVSDSIQGPGGSQDRD